MSKNTDLKKEDEKIQIITESESENESENESEQQQQQQSDWDIFMTKFTKLFAEPFIYGAALGLGQSFGQAKKIKRKAKHQFIDLFSTTEKQEEEPKTEKEKEEKETNENPFQKFISEHAKFIPKNNPLIQNMIKNQQQEQEETEKPQRKTHTRIGQEIYHLLFENQNFRLFQNESKLISTHQVQKFLPHRTTYIFDMRTDDEHAPEILLRSGDGISGQIPHFLVENNTEILEKMEETIQLLKELSWSFPEYRKIKKKQHIQSEIQRVNNQKKQLEERIQSLSKKIENKQQNEIIFMKLDHQVNDIFKASSKIEINKSQQKPKKIQVNQSDSSFYLNLCGIQTEEPEDKKKDKKKKKKKRKKGITNWNDFQKKNKNKNKNHNHNHNYK
ncbi:hypothetical protein M0811_04407 [Anaeramoeba ignava]|uniref:Uncharacterized protein n=1 Tax=Anaeramoeba ignava TaxID=1746090 RepID=A0A9Q0LT23_ANAIG|nr:hypothetical protein M0811_04407 [Anaeramoeba ignava]